jgi:hypothetical protein
VLGPASGKNISQGQGLNYTVTFTRTSLPRRLERRDNAIMLLILFVGKLICRVKGEAEAVRCSAEQDGAENERREGIQSRKKGK